MTSDELTFGWKGAAGRVLSRLIMSVFGLNKANRLYRETYDNEDYTGGLLKHLDISYDLPDKDKANIPAEGPLIVICNHPTGPMDGIAMINALLSVRSDVKFMSNYLLDRIEPFRKYIILVDPFDSKTRSMNMKGLKDCMAHVRGGGTLVIFPAGEVATWQKGFRDIKDKEWEPAVMRFIRKCEVPVLPVYLNARNSTLFRLMGKIHPRLRTAMLPHELFNKKGKTLRIKTGTAIQPRRLEDLDITKYSNYLRANVEYLAESLDTKKTHKNIVPVADMSGISPRPAVSDMLAELESVKFEYMLFETAEQALYCAPTASIPVIMTEIGRLREITFRQVGEGTMKELDIDGFDAYYHQLFLWDKTAGAIIGAYRMGFGDEIIPKYGIKGFYTDTLFRYDAEMAPVLEKSIELGRSFITSDYQKKPGSLMMLWKGIVYVLLKYRQFRNMIGPVTISGDFSAASKMIISTWLRENHYNEKLGPLVHPVNGMKGIHTDIDLSLIKGIDSVELMAKLVADIEHEDRTVPVLVKKYLGLKSSVLGFNVDPDFRDGLDALMLLDMKHMPENSIAMLSKEITDIDVVARFHQYHE